jgi:hypothetical protein
VIGDIRTRSAAIFAPVSAAIFVTRRSASLACAETGSSLDSVRADSRAQPRDAHTLRRAPCATSNIDSPGATVALKLRQTETQAMSDVCKVLSAKKARRQAQGMTTPNQWTQCG